MVYMVSVKPCYRITIYYARIEILSANVLTHTGRLASKSNFKAVFQRDKLLPGLGVCIISMLALASSSLIRAPRAVISAITT